MKRITILLVFAFFAMGSVATGQENASTVIKEAMRDEMLRNIEKLALENLQKPFYISYIISDAKAIYIKSSLGAIVRSEQLTYRKSAPQVLVGNYQRNQLNYIDMNTLYSSRWPTDIIMDNNYNGIRMGLWEETDALYKQAAEVYESKLSSINQQNLPPEELALEDFSREQKVVKDFPGVSFSMDRKQYETLANQLSAVFKDYPQIHSSDVCIYLYDADIYFINTEGTETLYPFTLAVVKAVAKTQAPDGEPLNDHAVFVSSVPEKLPAADVMKKEIVQVAENLVALKNSPSFNDSYSGPVLFEGQAVAEIVSQLLFNESKGLIAKRKPVISSPDILQMIGGNLENPMESRMGKKVITRELTVKATPKLKEYNGIQLAGSFEIDADGVVPEDELVLIDQGILKNMLNGRLPTLKIKKSNGHQRLSLFYGGVTPAPGPGVISVSSANPLPDVELKKKLIAAAKEEDMDYAIIIRKFESRSAEIINEEQTIFFGPSGQNVKPISRALYVYKVSLQDGSEQLIRTIELESISIRSFKRILGVSKKMFVYNTFLYSGEPNSYMYNYNYWTYNGMPVSFIVPDAMLFEELDIQKDKRPVVSKLPVVENPVKNKK